MGANKRFTLNSLNRRSLAFLTPKPAKSERPFATRQKASSAALLVNEDFVLITAGGIPPSQPRFAGLG
jgi:hypothetical protein